MSDVDCGRWADQETTTAQLPPVCRHCDVAVVAVSVGYVHADTHNTVGADGHRAAPALVIPENVTYIDEWERKAYPPVRAVSVNLPVLIDWADR